MSLVADKPIGFLLHEYLDQVEHRHLTIEADGSRLKAVLAARSRWHADNPAHDMMHRTLKELVEQSDSWQIETQIARDVLCLPETKCTRAVEVLQDTIHNCVRLSEYEQRVAAYKEVVHQRLSLEDGPDWLHSYEPTVEVTQCQRIYRALDAVVLGYYGDIFGYPWILAEERAEKPWLPLAVVGQPYSVTGPDVAYVPVADLHRTRLWPALAHEMAHLKLALVFGSEDGYLFRPGGRDFPRQDSEACVDAALEYHKGDLERLGITVDHGRLEEIVIWLDQLAKLVHRNVHGRILGSSEGGQTAPTWWYSQTMEFLCDAVGVHVAGPAMLLGYAASQAPMTSPANTTDADARRFAAARRHPPRLVRIEVMAEILKRRGFGDYFATWGLNEYSSYARELAGAKLCRHIEDTWMPVVERIAELAMKIAESVLPTRTRAFDCQAYAELEGAFDGLSYPARSIEPRFLLNVGWHKRDRISRAVMDATSDTTPEYDARALASANGAPLPGLYATVILLLNQYLDEQWSRIRLAAAGEESACRELLS